jgi:hypothetical protein
MKGKKRTPALREKLDALQTFQHMMDDKDLTGDLLIFALATLDVSLRFEDTWTSQVTKATGWDSWRTKHVVSRDVPRYEPEDNNGRSRCMAPLVRKEGTCGGSGSNGFHWRYNPDTGEWRTYWACTRHAAEAAKMVRAARMAWEANGKPQPANNTGGVLSKYFHTEKLYEWATPEYRKDQDRTPPAQRPALEVISNEAPELSIEAPARPVFLVVR